MPNTVPCPSCGRENEEKKSKKPLEEHLKLLSERSNRSQYSHYLLNAYFVGDTAFTVTYSNLSKSGSKNLWK